MSCQCGIQPTITDVALAPTASDIAASLFITLPCVTATPFGSPVEPDVY